jgi:hypothetical protein
VKRTVGLSDLSPDSLAESRHPGRWRVVGADAGGTYRGLQEDRQIAAQLVITAFSDASANASVKQPGLDRPIPNHSRWCRVQGGSCTPAYN